jgi:hypothetical protein
MKLEAEPFVITVAEADWVAKAVSSERPARWTAVVMRMALDGWAHEANEEERLAVAGR